MVFNTKEAIIEIKKKAEEEKIYIKQRKEQAKKEAKKIAKIMKLKDADIKQIYGFGSVFTDSEKFNRYSDIDIAIEGGNIFKLFSIAESSSFKIDLIELQGKNDYFENQIIKKGIKLL